MKKFRIPTAVLTVIISLMNLPIGFGDADIAAGLAWAITGLGLAGFVAATGLLRQAPWGTTAVLAVGFLNLVGASIALAADVEGAVIGLVLSAILLAITLTYFTLARREGAVTASSVIVAATLVLIGGSAVAAQATGASVDRVESFQTVVAVAPIDGLGPPIAALMRADCSFAQLLERPDGGSREIFKCQLSDEPVDVPTFQGTTPEKAYIDSGGQCIWISDYWHTKDGSTVYAESFEITVTPSGSVTGKADYPETPLDCPE